MPQPDREQSLRALGRAQAVRSARAQMKRGLKAGRIDPVNLLRGEEESWEPWIQDMRIDAVLGMIHYFGEVTVAQALEVIELPGRMTIAGLTYDKRGEIADLVYTAIYGIPAPPPVPS